MSEMENLIEKYFRPGRLPHIWCPGCGNGVITGAIVKAIDKINVTDLEYNEITELRYIAIRQVLIKYNVEVITDIPWGKGLLEYRNNWEKMMTEAIENRREN